MPVPVLVSLLTQIILNAALQSVQVFVSVLDQATGKDVASNAACAGGTTSRTRKAHLHPFIRWLFLSLARSSGTARSPPVQYISTAVVSGSYSISSGISTAVSLKLLVWGTDAPERRSTKCNRVHQGQLTWTLCKHGHALVRFTRLETSRLQTHTCSARRG